MAGKAVLALLVLGLAAAGVCQAGQTSAKLTMATLSAATNQFSPVFSSLYFTPKSPAYYFLFNNLVSNTVKQFTLFYPTDKALKKYNKAQKNLPVNCPAIPMRNNLAQQLVPQFYDKKGLKAAAKLQAQDLKKGFRKHLIPTMSPVALAVWESDNNDLMVGVLNNGYDRVMSNATIVQANAIVTRTYALHLIDNVLTTCI